MKCSISVRKWSFLLIPACLLAALGFGLLQTGSQVAIGQPPSSIPFALDSFPQVPTQLAPVPEKTLRPIHELMEERKTPQETVLLTIFLKHDQSKTLDEIRAQLDATGFWKKFPPEGIEIESWYVMMGLGHVVTLKVPPARLRDVNLAIEQTAWKSFRTEVYVTYDYKPIAESRR